MSLCAPDLAFPGSFRCHRSSEWPRPRDAWTLSMMDCGGDICLWGFSIKGKWLILFSGQEDGCRIPWDQAWFILLGSQGIWGHLPVDPTGGVGGTVPGKVVGMCWADLRPDHAAIPSLHQPAPLLCVLSNRNLPLLRTRSNQTRLWPWWDRGEEVPDQCGQWREPDLWFPGLWQSCWES